MKKHLQLIRTVIIVGAISYSCVKDDYNISEHIDKRDGYIGKYQVKEKISCYGPCGSCFSMRDTIISVNYGKTDSTLNVLGRDVYLDSTGSYYAYHYGLRLWNDSIQSNFINGGLGCGRYEVYTGFKISDKP